MNVINSGTVLGAVSVHSGLCCWFHLPHNSHGLSQWRTHSVHQGAPPKPALQQMPTAFFTEITNSHHCWRCLGKETLLPLTQKEMLFSCPRSGLPTPTALHMPQTTELWLVSGPALQISTWCPSVHAHPCSSPSSAAAPCVPGSRLQPCSCFACMWISGTKAKAPAGLSVPSPQSHWHSMYAYVPDPCFVATQHAPTPHIIATMGWAPWTLCHCASMPWLHSCSVWAHASRTGPITTVGCCNPKATVTLQLSVLQSLFSRAALQAPFIRTSVTPH